MSVPTYSQVIAAVETDLSSDVINGFILAATDEVESRIGADDEQVDDLVGGTQLVFPSRRVEEVTAAVEIASDDSETTLATDDYRLELNGRGLRRLNGGTNPATFWSSRVRVTYTPTGGDARHNAILNLVHLKIQYSPLAGHASGDYSQQQRDYERQRVAILSTLLPDQRQVA